MSAEAVAIAQKPLPLPIKDLVLKIPSPSFKPSANPNLVKSTQDATLGRITLSLRYSESIMIELLAQLSL